MRNPYSISLSKISKLQAGTRSCRVAEPGVCHDGASPMLVIVHCDGSSIRKTDKQKG